MGVMQSLVPDGAFESLPLPEEEMDVPAGIDSDMVESIDRERLPLRRWPAAVAELYRQEVIDRLYREEHFLFLLGLLLCMATIAVDLIVNPDMLEEGAILRVVAVAPLTLAGLIAGARGWTQALAFCVGAAPIAFIAVIVHLALQLPPDLAPRYLLATILVVGIANMMLPYSLRGLVIFDAAAIIVASGIIALHGPHYLALYSDTVVVFALAAAGTLPVAGRFERLRQHNFLLNLRARIFSRELLKANHSLQLLSETDPLTGIANRRCFERQFETEIVAPGEHGRADDLIALMMIDLDHFKAFNDTHGHQSGDYCLKLVASALQDIFDEAGGIVARYGGEEFVGAVRKREAAKIRAIAEDVRQTVAATLTPVCEIDRSLVTASVGVGVAPAAIMLPREELLEMADAALYSGKNEGRNKVVIVEAEGAFIPPRPAD